MISPEKHQTTKLERFFAVRKLHDTKYEGLSPLPKPHESSRGVYGGNLCASAMVVVMEDCPGFTPHSLHSYFVAAGDDSQVFQFEIERLHDSRSFKKRLVRMSQKGQLKYIVMVSMALKGDKKKGLEFQTPTNPAFYKFRHNEMPVHTQFDYGGLLQHKIPPSFSQLEPKQLQVPVAERELAFWIRVGDEGAVAPKFRYAGLGAISDSLFLSAISRLLDLPYYAKDPSGRTVPAVSVTGGKNAYFFGVSLDHSVFVHDDSFDPHEWIFVTFKAPRLVNNRVLLNASYYDRKGRLFASVVQEGLIYFHKGVERNMKL